MDGFMSTHSIQRSTDSVVCSLPQRGRSPMNKEGNMGRSLKKHVTVTFGKWDLTWQPERNHWKAHGEDGRQFSLWEMKAGKWRLSYQHIENGEERAGQVRKTFRASSLERAVGIAETLLPGNDKSPRSLTIEHVLAWWMDLQSCKGSTKQDYDQYNELFLKWCTARGLRRWIELDFDHLQTYANELASQGKASRTITLYTFPVRSAAKKASLKREWTGIFRNFAEGYEDPRAVNRGPRSKQETLRLDKACQFLLWCLGQGHTDLLPGMALQLLAGVAMEETLRMRWDRIDLAKGTATVEGEVKNLYRERTIPLPGMLVDLLALSDRTFRGKPSEMVAGGLDRHGWRKGVLALLEQWKPDLAIQVKNFRNTLPTERKLRKWSKEAMEAYIGHTGKSVTEKSYEWPTQEELLDFLRREVTSKVDKIIEPWRKKIPVREENLLQLPVRKG